MANHRNTQIAPELRERAIMRLMPSYNWSFRQVADDIGVGCTNKTLQKIPKASGFPVLSPFEYL